MKKTKIGLIVEGPTDKKFFEDYFKKKYTGLREIKVIPSATARNCDIQNERKIKSKIEDLRDKGCNEIYILIDLDSKCKKDVYHCVSELRNDYLSKMNLTKEKDLTVIVVSSELEAWMLSAWKKSDKKTKEDLKKEFSITSSKHIEEVLLKKFISMQVNINHENNNSLCYFLKKLKIVPEQEKCK